MKYSIDELDNMEGHDTEKYERIPEKVGDDMPASYKKGIFSG